MGDEQPRQPKGKDLKGILNFCTEVTAREDTTTTSDRNEMTEERKEWLNQALETLTANPVDRMKECVRVILEARDEETEHDRVGSLIEELTDVCEQIDMANDFYKIGGYEIFKGLFQSSNPELRSLTLELLATLVQNNPFSQKSVLSSGLLPTMLTLLDAENNDRVKVKALYAISCLVRDLPEAQKVFEDCDGFSKLMRAMQCDVEKLKVKAAFLLASLCLEWPAVKDILCDIGMVDQLVGQLRESHQPFHEHFMSALLALVTEHERSQQEAKRPELQLHAFLEDRVQYLKGKDEFVEEIESAEQILQICFVENKDMDSRSEACR